MDFLILALIATADFIVLLIYGIFVTIQVYKRSKTPHSLDGKMHNYGRIIMWSSVIGMTVVNRSVSDGTYSVVFTTILLVGAVIGSRLFMLSYRIEKEEKDTWYYAWDQWLVRMYKKYLEPIGK